MATRDLFPSPAHRHCEESKVKKIILNRKERDIEERLLKGEYISVNKNEFLSISSAVEAKREKLYPKNSRKSCGLAKIK